MANAIYDGMFGLADLMAQRFSTGQSMVDGSGFQYFVDLYNQVARQTESLFCTPTEMVQMRFFTAKPSRAQVMDPDALPLPGDITSSYDVAFPMRTFKPHSIKRGLQVTRMSDPMETARLFESVLTSAAKRKRDEILSILLNNSTSGISWKDPLYGGITVQPLANGDAALYWNQRGADSMATHDHYLGQAAAISDAANPFNGTGLTKGIWEHLAEHPENMVGENEGWVVVFICTDLIAAVQNLTNFRKIEDPDVRASTARDALVAGRPPIVLPAGAHWLGKCDRCWLVHWPAIPAAPTPASGEGYMLAVSSSNRRPLAIRTPPVASLKGLVFDDIVSTAYERFWQEIYGCGGYNRVAALAWAVGSATAFAGGDYVNPTGIVAGALLGNASAF